MITPLLAFDLIAPMIGSVVLAGAFSFFGGVLFARKKSNVIDIELGDRVTPGTFEAEIERLNRERMREHLENELLGEFSSQNDVSASLWTLLKLIVPQPASSFAAVIGTGSGWVFPTAARGLSEQSIEQFTIPPELVTRLKTEHLLVVDREPDTTGIFRRLTDIDREKASKLFLTTLYDGENVFAVLVASTLWPSGLTEREQRSFMKHVAKPISHHLRQMLVIEQKSRELRSTQEMLELREIVDSQTDDPLESLEKFAKRLRTATSADRVAVYFVARRAGEQLQPIVQCGRPLPPGTKSIWGRHERALANIAIESELGNLIDGESLRNLQVDSLITSAATQPIRVNGRVLGALCLTRQGQDDSLDSHRKLIEFAAEILSQSLRRVLDEATMRRRAVHDHLTDLVNRRSLDEYLAVEVERVNRGESNECSLILADLDRFKSINDRFGHQSGDHVLRETARVMAEQVGRLRTGERSIVARYGGEEFAILLPDVGMAGALRIAEQIRAAIEQESVQVQNVSLPLTVSIGVAVCPHQANAAEALIALADKALYQAKANGRNCVCSPEDVVDGTLVG